MSYVCVYVYMNKDSKVVTLVHGTSLLAWPIFLGHKCMLGSLYHLLPNKFLFFSVTDQTSFSVFYIYIFFFFDLDVSQSNHSTLNLPLIFFCLHTRQDLQLFIVLVAQQLQSIKRATFHLNSDNYGRSKNQFLKLLQRSTTPSQNNFTVTITSVVRIIIWKQTNTSKKKLFKKRIHH